MCLSWVASDSLSKWNECIVFVLQSTILVPRTKYTKSGSRKKATAIGLLKKRDFLVPADLCYGIVFARIFGSCGDF